MRGRRSGGARGNAVQDQLSKLLDEGVLADVNGNAVRLIRERLGDLHEGIEEACVEWLLNQEDACPGCGVRPGDGVRCSHPLGCGTVR